MRCGLSSSKFEIPKIIILGKTKYHFYAFLLFGANLTTEGRLSIFLNLDRMNRRDRRESKSDQTRNKMTVLHSHVVSCLLVSVIPAPSKIGSNGSGGD